MLNKSKTATRIYWLIVALAFGTTTTMLFVYTPVEQTMGPIQKLFYVHLPSAICAFLACVVAFVGGIGYLWQKKMMWDDLSFAAAKIAALLCTVVLLTGMIWGHSAWGVWWAWTPRLTFSLLLWLLYVVYLIIRPCIESRDSRAVVSAVYVVAAFLDVPLIYLSVRLIPDYIHPKSVELIAPMKLTLAAWFVPIVLLTVGMITACYRRNRRLRLREASKSVESAWSVTKSESFDANSVSSCNEPKGEA